MAAEEQATLQHFGLQAPVDQRGNGRLPCSRREVGVREGRAEGVAGTQSRWAGCEVEDGA